MMIVCGIDPSLTGTAVVWGESITEFNHERLSSKPCGDGVVARMRRLESLVGKIDKLIRMIGPDLILIEGYSFGSKCNREFLGEFGGVCRWHLIDHTPNVLEVSPSHLKQFVTGKGNAKKDVVAAHCANRWGVMFDDSDTYDAFGLYAIALAAAGQFTPGTAIQSEVVGKILAGHKLTFEPRPHVAATT